MSIKEHVNEATRFRREVMMRVAEAYMNDGGEDAYNRIPYDIFPKDSVDDNYRCCIYKDREVIKHRCLAATGACVQSVKDDYRAISEYAKDAEKRTEIDKEVLTVLDIACKSCIQAQYTISNICRGCIARPCTINCPVDCITVEHHQARIDTSRCINCGKCKQVCPYHAVVRVPVPCEEACPVDAIRRNNETGKQRIDFSKCTSCGRCMRACPFGAIMEKSQIIDVLKALKEGKEVIAMCAPAISGQFPGGLGAIITGIKKLGFSEVVEVALGADQTCKHEAAEFKERIIEKGEDFMTTSCCPSYVEAAKKHIPELLSHISETPTPMHYIAKHVKKNKPEVISVFIGPCVAKRYEGVMDEYVDFVLTFEELGAIFEAAKIETAILEEEDISGPASSEGRGFAITGGVAQAVQYVSDKSEAIKPIKVNGLSHEGIAQLRDYANNGCHEGNLVEVMTCEGGCINGAGVHCSPGLATKAVKEFADNSQHLEK